MARFYHFLNKLALPPSVAPPIRYAHWNKALVIRGFVMLRKIVPAAAALAVLVVPVSESFAGKAVACYEQYRTQPVYDTVYESVMVRPASQYVQTEPAIYGTRKR